MGSRLTHAILFGVVLIVFTLIALAGCTPSPSPVNDPRAVWCAVEHPIRLTQLEIEQASNARLAEIVTHNRKGAAWCGWRA